ncbi:MAG: Yip1 family protein [Anaerolineae bacterium]
MIQGVNFSEMISQSIKVLTQPRTETFEEFEKHGGQREALTYVGVAAGLAGVVAFIVGIFSGPLVAIIALLGALIAPLLSFFVFAFVINWMGKQQGGTGTQDEVFYTCSLYTAPILAVTGIVGNIPVLGCLFAPVSLVLGLYQLYLGYLATRASMNLDQNKAIITVIVAIVAQWIVFAVIGVIVAAIAISMGVTTGAIPPS